MYSRLQGPSARKPTSPAPARPSSLRQENLQRLLQLLREHAPCSKADLARASGLSAPAVSAAMAQLASLGLTESLGGGSSTGGRPPELLRLRTSDRFVAAADIGGTRVRMMLADLNGQPAAEWSTVLKRDQKTPEAVCQVIAAGLKALCGETGVARRNVLHLCAGAPGITNTDQGIVLAAPNLRQWTDVPLRTLLRRATGIASSVENDTNLAALGEHLRGVAQGVNDFVFLALGTGIGAGIYLAGKIHHGAQWSAGEIGYFGLPGEPRGPVRLRETGALESAIAGKGIERLWLTEMDRRGQRDTQLRALRAPHVFDRVESGDPAAVAVLEQVASSLASVIVDLGLLLNPALVVLGGGIGSHPALCHAVSSALSSHEFARPSVRSSALGAQAQLFGGVVAALDAVQAGLRC